MTVFSPLESPQGDTVSSPRGTALDPLPPGRRLALLLICGFLVAGLVAAQDPQSEGAASELTAPEGQRAPGTPPAGETDRYLVSFMRSTTASKTGGSINVSTVVSVANLGTQNCDVSLRFTRAFRVTPTCEVTLTVEPGENRTFCSRDLRLTGASGFVSCTAACDPDLDFDDGRIFVSSTDGAGCADLGVSANIFYTSVNDDTILAASNPQTVQLP